MSDESIPTFEPTEITAGETLKWTKTLEDYPASQGYTLKYYFRGAGTGFDVTATADGDGFSVTVTAITTSAMTPGAYYWQAEISKNGEKFIVDSGEVTVLAGLSATSTSTTDDARSPAKKIIDAIDAYFAGGAAAKAVQEYQIGNRMMRNIPDTEKIKLREYYAKLYARERRAQRIKQGAPYLKTIMVRFRNPR
ncbi:MAG: hypothetical protein M3362_19260 [Acidobacteriota bacterium]|nr:hypothetical protein [Acidobacteriota bacterium]